MVNNLPRFSGRRKPHAVNARLGTMKCVSSVKGKMSATSLLCVAVIVVLGALLPVSAKTKPQTAVRTITLKSANVDSGYTIEILGNDFGTNRNKVKASLLTSKGESISIPATNLKVTNDRIEITGKGEPCTVFTAVQLLIGGKRISTRPLNFALPCPATDLSITGYGPIEVRPDGTFTFQVKGNGFGNDARQISAVITLNDGPDINIPSNGIKLVPGGIEITGKGQIGKRLIAVRVLAGGKNVTAACDITLTKPTAQITEVNVKGIKDTKNDPEFTMEIKGKNFGDDPNALTVALVTSEGNAIPVTIGAIKSTGIDVTGSAKLGTVISQARVTLAGIATTFPFKFTLKPSAAPPPFKTVEIKFKVDQDDQYKNLFTILITKEGGNGNFSANPNYMQVDILPSGVSNVRIRPATNPEQLVVDFMAPEKFVVKDVVVTVFDSTDLDSRQPVAIAKPFKEKTPTADPNQPTISDVDIMYLQRSLGIGRVKIDGSGFGKHDPPPLSGDDYLLGCYANRNFVSNNFPVINEQVDRNKPNNGTRTDTDQTKCSAMRKWIDEIEQSTKVVLIGHTPSVRVERTKILYINDKLIDVYFEFTLVSGFSQPFRLARAVVTVNKNVKKTDTKQTDIFTAVLETEENQTFEVSRDFGIKRDDKLQFRYSILDKVSAESVFGKGVANNFYILQLSVVNISDKKVAVPLASIQAEIEWKHRTNDASAEYLEGPATISPLPLATVSGYFDSYNKTKGTTAKLFNILDGLTVLGSALIPVLGPSFPQAHAIFTGGVIPGLRKATGDLSGQQLQNLTSLSWQNIEVVAAGGGSIDKFIYIPRTDGVLGNGKTIRAINDIVGIEVIGFQVIESEAKKATEK